MKMKPIPKVLFSVFLGVTFLFLSGFSFFNNSNDQQKIEIEFFNQKSEIAQGLRNVGEAFEKENPDVDVTITTVTSRDGGAALLSKFTSGNAPTMMMLGGLPDIDFYKDYLLEMDNQNLTREMLPQLLGAGTLNDHILALPMGIEGFGFMYNREIFAQAGIEANEIQSFADFKQAVEILDNKKEELGITEVFAYEGEDENIANHFFANFVASEFDDDNNTAFNATELTWENGERMKDYTDLINQHTVQPVVTMTHTHSVEDLFFNDNVAMIHQGNWIVPALNDMDPSFVQEKLGILPVFADDDLPGRNVAGSNWVIGVNKTKDEPEVQAAIDFLEFLYTSEEGKKIIADEFQLVPPTKDVDINEISAPVSRQLYQEVLDDQAAPMTYKQEPYGFLRASLAPNFQKYLAGQLSWKEFTKRTSADFEQMRKVQTVD
ncbi:ABC transporter substrate-binding protein [Tetragenococcus muriaticus]|uniref:Periplasmic component of an ABC superfamily sugar transporter n=2 Tax=Tetragenococcus muriaticus TaxID=64642 RepID=A0A091BWT0_9ENTE|nr:ABC transporter substrate-binding protein [Tetragenococcus muriaticus]KFN90091.1 periplasmic component of an ABC superfamily sugar transporter [Tetragenococcus muriaticus 3MR10-3]KFN90435.1 periplasmic component of an ABC superfamily sugar transporter [Tetragenococcus muriaticus PMC-11-5]